MARLDPVDVVVVGAGLGGSAFCARLSERAPHLRIVCLERGDWVDRAAMPAYQRDWQRAALGAWATSPNARLAAAEPSQSADYPIDDSTSPIKPLMWNGVGGSTINWAAHVPRLHPSDFRTRTLDGVGDDWPFSYFDLEPYYDLNDVAMGVAGLALVAVRRRDQHRRSRGPARLQQRRPLPHRLPHRCEGIGRHRLLARGPEEWRRAADEVCRAAGDRAGRARDRRGVPRW